MALHSNNLNFNFTNNLGYFTTSNDFFTTILYKRHENEKFFDRFVDESGKTLENKETRRKTTKISRIREILTKFWGYNRELENLSAELKNNDNLTDFEWKIKLERCESLKNELNTFFNDFYESEETLRGWNKEIAKRRRKRDTEKRKKAKLRSEKENAMQRKIRREIEANNWIREKREEIEREKAKESLRRDADLVLFDVRAKRSDARKFSAILKELKNLRKIKAKVSIARGENLNSAAERSFENIIGHLADQWTRLDQEYAIEEQGLKLMLKTDNEKKLSKQKRSSFDDWELILFGRKLRDGDSTEKDIRNLLIVREAWDRYISSSGSRIPIGWIIPAVPSSAAWQKSLKTE